MIVAHRLAIGLLFVATVAITAAAKVQAPLWIFAVCIGLLVTTMTILSVLDVRLAGALDDRDGFLSLLAQDARSPIEPLVPPHAPRCTLCRHCKMGRNLLICTLPRHDVKMLPCAMARDEDGDCGPEGTEFEAIPILPAPPRHATAIQ